MAATEATMIAASLGAVALVVVIVLFLVVAGWNFEGRRKELQPFAGVCGMFLLLIVVVCVVAALTDAVALNKRSNATEIGASIGSVAAILMIVAVLCLCGMNATGGSRVNYIIAGFNAICLGMIALISFLAVISWQLDWESGRGAEIAGCTGGVVGIILIVLTLCVYGHFHLKRGKDVPEEQSSEPVAVRAPEMSGPPPAKDLEAAPAASSLLVADDKAPKQQEPEKPEEPERFMYPMKMQL